MQETQKICLHSQHRQRTDKVRRDQGPGRQHYATRRSGSQATMYLCVRLLSDQLVASGGPWLPEKGRTVG